ncbi:porin [Photobacterium leiognathi]|uniref:porin n=1 Tax=Photobacterium leiognathi TaxID=553611 RepID=UPI001EDDA216|nr:porin [Photobacterium leiognathi]MCG3885692.1 porin [Photobacterium leiognathi]
MENMFKRTLLGAAIATAAMASTGANAAIDLMDGKVQLYGQAAGFMMYDNPKADGKEDTITANIESRIGFRGTVDFDNFSPNLVWQIEGGDAANSGGSADGNGGFGGRDTFVGFDFNGVGSFKYGRQLVAAYNYVDWPHSNPGLGNVFDWNNDISGGYEDRANNVLRYDSANFGGFNVQATVSNMASTTKAIAYSVASSYSADAFSVHAGYYAKSDYKDDTGAQVYGSDYTIFGGSLFLGNVTLTAAGKYMTADTVSGEDSQWAYSTTAQYVHNGKWVYKVGYAGTADADYADGASGDNTSDMALTARLGYLLPSAYLYTDIRHYDMNGDDEAGDTTRLLMGVEYYF